MMRSAVLDDVLDASWVEACANSYHGDSWIETRNLYMIPAQTSAKMQTVWAGVNGRRSCGRFGW